jgi:Zn-dependent protease
MGEVVDLIDKVKKYYRFTPSELRGFIISILVVAFIISFREWGRGAEIDIGFGLINFLNALLVTALTFIVYNSAHRITALVAGFKAEYKMWTFGLLAGLVFAFVSNGRIWILLPGGILYHHLAGHRIGWFRHELNYFAMGVLSLWGPIACIFLAIFFKIIGIFTFNALIHKAVILNLALAVYAMLPIPPMPGSKVFYGSRMLFAFSFCAIVAAAILLAIDINVLLAIIGAFLIGVICWLLYYILLEKGWWQGPFPKMKV